uniref:DZIP3-like HEPN domain-containing protein n=1 Tax=Magallana gigas TaxID=29159 RepID=A0A8W8JTH5_MAGGI
MLTCTFTWAGQNFVSVADCPKDANGWELRSKEKSCYGDTPDYLCAAIENKEGEFGEICTKYGLTPSNKCAVLNAQTHNLDSVECKAASGCPSQPYIPSELWRYTICYGNFYEMTTTSTHNITPRTTNAGSRNGTLVEDRPIGGDSVFGAGLAVAVVFILIIVVVVVVLVVFYVTNKFGFREKVQQLNTDLRQRLQHRGRTDSHQESDDLKKGANADQPLYAKPDKDKTKKEQTDPAKPEKAKTKKEKLANTTDTDDKEERGHRGKHDGTEQNVKKLRELLKYLVHILKQELGVNDLQEKIVLHSKSIEEHFTAEPLRKELQSVKNLNDYDRLDMSLVFALLRNFCEEIKAPMRGWDYEPPDEENNVAADIERIRFMWNKYCDNDLQFKHLDDVYNRMKQKFGTVPVHGGDGNKKHKDEDDFELMKDKIQSVKLNPDCTVEEDIVITESITSALKILNSRNVVILKGAIGCGKTHALKAIQNHFKSSWETKWEDTLTIESEIIQEKPTILLYDNFFGRFGNRVLSQGEIDRTEKVLKAVGGNIKVVIGIHSHVYEEVKKTFRLDFLSQKNITVEMDKLSDAETLLIFKEQRRIGHCKVDSERLFRSFGFQSVLDMLSKNQGQIGGPFLSLMYCNQHEFFLVDAFSHNPVQTLVQHFLKVKQESPILYNCLVYLMCVQRHNCQEEPMKWIRETDADITKDAITKMFTTSGCVYVEDNTASLAHDILTIALFKSAAEADEYLLRVVENCDVDVMLQLLRSPGTAHNDLCCDFMDVNNKKRSNHRKMAKEFVYRFASKYRDIKMVHPLFKIKFVSEKYSKYVKDLPNIKKSKV